MDAIAFASAFDLSSVDYAELSRLYDLFKDPQSAACTWLKENQAKWGPWIKFPQRMSAPMLCRFDQASETGVCNSRYWIGWIIFWCQGVAFLAIAFVSGRMSKNNKTYTDDEARVQIKQAIADPKSVIDDRVEETRSKWFKWLVDHSGNYRGHLDIVNDMHDVPFILRHKRSYESFSHSNLHPDFKLPPMTGPERWCAEMSRRTLYTYLFVSEGKDLRSVLLFALGLGLASGALSTALYQYISYETYKHDPVAYTLGNPFDDEGSTFQFVVLTGRKIDQLTTGFKFFPSFLALGYVGYAISRWRDFQSAGYSVQGAIGSTAAIVGSGLTNPADERCRQLAFRVYRLLQVLHIICYQNVNRWYKLLELDDLEALGLLTTEEVRALAPAKNKQHEVIVSWIMAELYRGQTDHLINSGIKIQDVTMLRSKVATLRDLFSIGQPNLWAALMRLVCDLLVMMFVAGASFESFLYQLGPFQFVSLNSQKTMQLGMHTRVRACASEHFRVMQFCESNIGACMQYVVIFSAFLAIPWLCAQRLVVLVNNPWTADHEMFNCGVCFSNICKRSLARSISLALALAR